MVCTITSSETLLRSETLVSEDFHSETLVSGEHFSRKLLFIRKPQFSKKTIQKLPHSETMNFTFGNHSFRRKITFGNHSFREKPVFGKFFVFVPDIDLKTFSSNLNIPIHHKQVSKRFGSINFNFKRYMKKLGDELTCGTYTDTANKTKRYLRIKPNQIIKQTSDSYTNTEDDFESDDK